MAAPRTGHISHGSEKGAAADSWFPCGFFGGFGESPVGLVFPLRAFGDFWGLTVGPVGLHVACLLHLHSASCVVGT